MPILVRTSAVIEDCELFLKSTPNIAGSPVESYLVQHVLVVLCADIQQEVYSIVRARAAEANDRQLAKFVSGTAERVLRSVKKSDLAGFVEFFGQDEKEKFNRLVDESDVTTYNNAVNNRHHVAHHYGVQVTFSELKSAFLAASKILLALASAIEIRNT